MIDSINTSLVSGAAETAPAPAEENSLIAAFTGMSTQKKIVLGIAAAGAIALLIWYFTRDNDKE